MFDNIRIVLVNPSHPGNIGGAARAMKNMGLSELYLVNPEDYPHQNATARAAGADDILQRAVVVNTLQEALVGCDCVYGASARQRSLKRSLLDARQAGEKIVAEKHRSVALLFGRERSGLTNEELAICHYHICIPSDETFSSLNLAAAVQVMSYELRMASLAGAATVNDEERDLATMEQMMGFYDHLKDTLIQIGFMDPRQPKLLMERLERLFTRAEVDKTELNILRGILSDIYKSLPT